jgi:hypothetical protein
MYFEFEMTELKNKDIEKIVEITLTGLKQTEIKIVDFKIKNEKVVINYELRNDRV